MINSFWPPVYVLFATPTLMQRRGQSKHVSFMQSNEWMIHLHLAKKYKSWLTVIANSGIMGFLQTYLNFLVVSLGFGILWIFCEISFLRFSRFFLRVLLNCIKVYNIIWSDFPIIWQHQYNVTYSGSFEIVIGRLNFLISFICD